MRERGRSLLLPNAFIAIFIIGLVHFWSMTRFDGISTFGFLGLAVFSLAFSLWNAFPMVLLFLISALYLEVVPHHWLTTPILKVLIPAMVTAGLVQIFLANKKLLWFVRGRLDPNSVALLILIGMVSVITLLIWAFWTNNLGIGVKMMRDFSHFSHLMIFVVPGSLLFGDRTSRSAQRLASAGPQGLNPTFQTLLLSK